MKFLGVTVLVAFISLGGVNCYSVSRNNLQVGCSVPIEDVWTDLSRGKTSIKRLILFQFYLFKSRSPSVAPFGLFLFVFKSQQNASFTKRRKRLYN